MKVADDSKIWIFQSIRSFNEMEIQTIKSKFEHFLTDWNAHGAALLADYQIIDNQFIVVAVDENQAAASGCSIDKLTQLIKALEEQYQFGFLDRMNVAYEKDNQINIIKLNDFKTQVKNGDLDLETVVYNNGITNLKDFREQWKLPLSKSWAKNLIPH